jgi:hypothetical protein
MQVRIKHLAIPVSIIAGVGAALITSAVAQSGARSVQSATPLAQTPPLSANLTGADELRTGPGANPTGHPTATGQALITINTTTNEICAFFTPSADLGPYTAFHIHDGDSTVRNGPILVNFAVTPGTTGPLTKCVTDPVNAPDIAADPASFYFNVHTTAFPLGAISGQLSHTSETQLLSAPYRAYDSRFGGLTPFAPNTTRTIDLSASGIPLGARAAIVTVTVTRANAAGFLTVYSAALTAAPNTSNVNFGAAVDAANNITVATDGTGKIKVTSGATGNEDVIVDVVGFVV